MLKLCFNEGGKINVRIIIYSLANRVNCNVYNLLGMVEMIITKSKFHITAEELKELDKENNKKLLELLEYLRKRNDKKIKKEND